MVCYDVIHQIYDIMICYDVIYQTMEALFCSTSCFGCYSTDLLRAGVTEVSASQHVDTFAKSEYWESQEANGGKHFPALKVVPKISKNFVAYLYCMAIVAPSRKCRPKKTQNKDKLHKILSDIVGLQLSKLKFPGPT